MRIEEEEEEDRGRVELRMSYIQGLRRKRMTEEEED